MAAYSALPDEAVAATTSAPGDEGIAVSVVGFRTLDDAEKTTYYEIAVDDRDGGKRWKTFRRYREFRSLYETLNHSPVVKELVKGLDFPSRGWSFKKTATLAEERRVKLNDYLRVCSSLSVVATHPSFVAFIRPRGVPGDKSADSVAASALEKTFSASDLQKTSWESEKRDLEANLEATAKATGATSAAVATVMWTIGLRAKSHRKFDEAISWYTRALEMQEGLLGGNNLDVARTLNSIGNCYQAMQRLSDARSSFERALGIQEAAGEHALAAETLVNLGVLAEISGDHVSAEAHYRRALSIQESHLGDHHDTAATLSNIGCMYQALRKLDEAEGVLKRAVDILQRLSRSSTDKTLLNDTATALFNLGNLYKKSKRLVEAEDCYRRAVGVLSTAFGAESLEVARAMNNLANLLKKQEKFSEAEDLYERTVGIRTKLLGSSPDTANALYNLALLYELSNNLPAAEKTFVSAVEMYQSLHMVKQAETTKLYRDRVHMKRRMLERPVTQLTHK